MSYPIVLVEQMASAQLVLKYIKTMLVKNPTPKYSYNDVVIRPNEISRIKHRSECNALLRHDKHHLPIFTAPMSTVVDLNNYELFEKNHIYPIIPRNIALEDRLYIMQKQDIWIAVSLKEFEDCFCKTNPNWLTNTKHVLIDVANGHMQQIYDLVKIAKSIYHDSLIVMVGNVANPQIYQIAYESGVDYIRAGIGGGAGCITSSNTAIHYPMASLISELAEEKERIFRTLPQHEIHPPLPAIVADGGVRNYSDVIKALALGADYVMIGSVFAALVESAAPIQYQVVGTENSWFNRVLTTAEQYSLQEIDQVFKLPSGEKLHHPTKIFYGMASKEGQIAINGVKTKTSEGIKKTLAVTTNLHKWVDNMIAYIQSCMSYLGIRYIEEIADESDVFVISENTRLSINK